MSIDIVIYVGEPSDNLMYLIEPLGTSDLETLEASACDILHYMPIDLACMKLHCFLIRHCQKNKLWHILYFISVK